MTSVKKLLRLSTGMLIGSLTLVSGSVSSHAQLSGGGDLNPDLSLPLKAIEDWMDRRVGLSVHWGPSSLGGEEISWSRGKLIDKEIYDNYYRRFSPDKFDADEWAKLMKRWGMRYMAPTSKHHDGFALWFSDYTDYDMENAKLPIDIMAELAQALRKKDIWLGAYYSNLDWYHPDWTPYEYGGPGSLIPALPDSPSTARYFQFMEDQVKELIRKYDVDFIQFDGEWDDTYTHEIGSRMYRIFHQEKPNILLNSRIDIARKASGEIEHIEIDGAKYAGDFQDRERLVTTNDKGNNVIAWADHPWQAWVTIDRDQWSYNEDPNLLGVDELILDMIGVVGNNGNYMINLGPRPDGSFEPEQVALMDELGLWLKKHSAAIYGTRGGPFYPFDQGVSTRNKDHSWLFIWDMDTKVVRLKMPDQKLLSASVFGSNEQVPFTNQDGQLCFDLTKVEYEGPVKVIELRFAANVEMVE